MNIEPYSYEFHPQVMIDETRIFSTKMEMGEYLIQCFERAGVGRSSVIGNYGLWTWLAYLWFEQLSPVMNGARKLRETAKYICSSHYTDYYRHFIAAPYYIYALNGEENSRLFLYNPVYEHNDFIEQLASRQNIISHRNLVDVAHRLYWDASSNCPRRGAQTRNRVGNHRRLVKIFAQLELTYDIYSMEAEEILNLLPEEFNSWKR